MITIEAMAYTLYFEISQKESYHDMTVTLQSFKLSSVRS